MLHHCPAHLAYTLAALAATDIHVTTRLTCQGLLDSWVSRLASWTHVYVSLKRQEYSPISFYITAIKS
jgi:hypothetical protein